MQKTKSKLAQAVKIFNKAKVTRGHLLVLSNDEVQFVSSDYTCSYEFALILKDKFETSSDIFVSYKDFKDFLKLAKNNEVLDFKSTDDGIEISNGVIKKVYDHPDLDCRVVKLHEYSQKLTVNTKEFLHALNATVPFTDTNNPKTEVNALAFDTSTSGFKLVATDTRTVVTIDISSTPKLETQKPLMVLHSKALLELVKNCKDATISLEFSETNLKVETSEFILQTGLCQGIYMNYKKIIPDEGSENYPKFSELPADELLAMLSPYKKVEGYITLKSTPTEIDVILNIEVSRYEHTQNHLGKITIANNNDSEVGVRMDSFLVCLETLKNTNKKALAQFKELRPLYVKADNFIYMSMPRIK